MRRRRRKCPVCGLYLGASPHTGALHDRIRAVQKRSSKRGRARSALGRFLRRGPR